MTTYTDNIFKELHGLIDNCVTLDEFIKDCYDQFSDGIYQALTGEPPQYREFVEEEMKEQWDCYVDSTY